MTSFLWVVASMVVLGAVEANYTRRVWGDQFFSPILLQHLDPPFKKVRCNDAEEIIRYQELEKIECHGPKEVLVHLRVPTYLHASPGQMWVKRCVGYCGNIVTCQATEKKTLKVPIRIYNVKTDKSSCATYEVVEHTACECRPVSVD